MKKIFLTILLGLIANFGLAQNINFGLKGGAIFNTDKGQIWKDATNNIYKKDGKSATGFQAGALLRVSLTGLYIQPEVLYSQFKNEYEYQNVKTDVTKKRLDIPVNFGKRFLGFGHIQAGPVFSYYFDDKISLKNITKAKQDDFNVGFQVGTGVEIASLLLDLRYEFGFGKTISKFIKDGTEFTTENRPQMLNLSLAYLF